MRCEGEGQFPCWTRNEEGEKIHANLSNYGAESLRRINWTIDPLKFGDTVQRPDFIFFRCGKK